jgi:hypothetical protein
MVAIALLSAILFPILTPSREQSPNQICTSNQRQIVASFYMYAQDHEGLLPHSDTAWPNICMDSGVLTCPNSKELKRSYLFNNNLSEINIKKISSPAKKMMTIDGNNFLVLNRKYKNIYYTPTDVQYRHFDKVKNQYYAIASFVDGHVGIVTKITEPESWDKPIIQKKTGVKK